MTGWQPASREAAIGAILEPGCRRGGIAGHRAAKVSTPGMGDVILCELDCSPK